MDDPQHTLSKLLSLVIHDLRNPAAALGINLPYVREVLELLPEESISGEQRQDLLEALDESGEALAGLLLGLEQFGWVALWMAGESAMAAADGDLAAELHEFASRETRMKIELRAPERGMNVEGANAIMATIDILIANASQHAPAGSAVAITARDTREGPLVEVRDQGPAVAADLRETIFTVEGQLLSKKRSDGRYGRVVALLAAGALARAAGAVLEADEDEGRALFRLRAKAAS
jgi:two-component system sensor histidine kinase/response regulator